MRIVRFELSKPVSHRARMPGVWFKEKDWHLTKFEQRPRILVKPSSRELWTLLSGLSPFDNMAIKYTLHNCQE